ncbi:MAG TPA: 50S ribosomal protein L15e [candidate division Zixibacteria bacterium]|nr:50S ribosomal protein L15e [candidate division Zixibacteria bacterium]
MYKYVGEFWKNRNSPEFKALQRERLIVWRKESTAVRIERPTRIDRARTLGYKAKQGYVLVRIRIRRTRLRKSRPSQGRHTKGQTIRKIQPGKSFKWIAEERVSRRYPNLELLNSYTVGEDGRFKWYEVILVDPHHPIIKKDPRINWICTPANTGRVFRGLTSAGKKSRGLSRKGTGSERIRPSLRAHKRDGK